MKSIRVALLLYFLVLLGVALGAASVLAYKNAEGFLKEKADLRQKLLMDQCEELCHKEQEKLDHALAQQARGLAWQARRLRSLHLASLNMVLSAGFDRFSCLSLPLWIGEDGRSPFYEDRERQLMTEFHEEGLPRYGDGQVTEYFQINYGRGKPWRSRSMGDRSFPFDADRFAAMQFFVPELDNTELEPGIAVHRLSFKAPLWFRFWPGPRPRHPERASVAPDRPTGPLEGIPRSSPALLIQCAAETTQLEAKLSELRADLDNARKDLATESNSTLAKLRNRLLFISLATFAATIIGGFLLIRAGLAPLRRLSVAVGQVSEKDFRLPFDEKHLPIELRPIVERLTQTLDQLKRAFAREKQAAADISHELRTPLAALLTTIEVALRKPRSSEEYRELLADCHATGQQMSQLVERLLALARLDAGVDTLRSRVVDVAALAEQCAELVQPLAEARGLSLQVHRNGPAHVSTDPDKLREVLTNLLHNAIEYNRPQGRIDLSVEQNAERLQIEVRDTGIGIAPEAREHIFERFYRADPARQAAGLHAGLGLAIVKSYVDLMGGVIEVESEVGRGSTFRMELPVGRTVLPRRIHQESSI